MSSKVILLTGGTGSFGRGFVNVLLEDSNVRMVRIFSRDEHKQHDMRRRLAVSDAARVSFYIGDVRDRPRLERAMDGVNYVVHAAALKQAPLGEIEGLEFIKTNVEGSSNVVEAALAQDVEKALLISSDKAVEPINLYGATKMLAERLFLQADAMRGTKRTRFACTRYGNVVGTSGSVVPLFLSLPDDAPTPVTDPESTRYWITLAEANRFVHWALFNMQGGDLLIPKMKSARIIDVAHALRPGKPIKVIGLRPGDKKHEVIYVDHNQRYSSEQEERLGEEAIRLQAGIGPFPRREDDTGLGSDTMGLQPEAHPDGVANAVEVP